MQQFLSNVCAQFAIITLIQEIQIYTSLKNFGIAKSATLIHQIFNKKLLKYNIIDKGSYSKGTVQVARNGDSPVKDKFDIIIMRA